jgi:DNA polymerase III subunit gamma/tau
MEEMYRNTKKTMEPFMSAPYVVIARRYRPKTFSEVVGQPSIVRTLKRAITSNTTSHAYIFAGQRGTGKTTLARLYAKALNCEKLSSEGEPCNQCNSCLEITDSRSIDVQEIDGASNRGIDHIRSLTQSTCYIPAHAPFKIYIIDEVHMLTKEAFNALLKTLEEPPPKVKFLFATTEIHKIPATIQSRCQRFLLKRLPIESIIEKLNKVLKDLNFSADPEALLRLATYADGGLRDAESLLDQLLSFSDGHISCEGLEEVLGLTPQSFFVQLNKAIQTVDLQAAYALADGLFYQGKDISHCIEDISNHIRDLLLFKLGVDSSSPLLNSLDADIFKKTASFLSKEQYIELLRLLSEAQKESKTSPSQRFLLEMLLIDTVTISRKIPLPQLVSKLEHLEQRLQKAPQISLPQVEKEQKNVPQKEEETQTAPQEPFIVIERESPLKNLSPEQEQVRFENLIHFAATELNANITMPKK